MKRSVGILSALMVLSASAPALAQNYVVTSSQQTYVPLTGATPVTLTPTGSFSAADEGIATIQLGFSFPYYGQNHTSVGVHSNGVILIGTAAIAQCSSGFSCYNLGAYPSTTQATSLIAPWNADLTGPSGQIRYLQPSPSEIVIEYHNWGYLSYPATYSYQVRLNASGLFQVHYGPFTGTTSTSTGAGWKDHTGSQGQGLLACGTSSRNCGAADWPANTLITVGQPVQADLYVDSVDIQSLTKTGNDITLTVEPTFRNFGQTAATNFHWKAYLSTDRTSLTGAIEFFDSAVLNQPASVPGIATASAVGTGTAVNVPPGNYYVLVEADSTGVIPEFSESNNVGASVLPFTQGFDVVAQAVGGAPVQSEPGHAITVNVSWTNQGTDPSGGPVKFELYLSVDEAFDSNDFLIHDWTEPQIAGGQSRTNQPQSFTVPANVPGGHFHWILRANAPPNPLPEASTANNTVASAARSEMLQTDLEILSAELLNASGIQPIREGFLGEKVVVSTTYRNIGGVDVSGFRIGVALSKDASLSLLPGGDFIFHDEDVGQVIAGANPTTATFEVTLPLVDRGGNPVAAGSYYVFVILDSYRTLTQLSTSNDTKGIGAVTPEPINMRRPAADYAVIKVDVPAAAGVGEVMPLYRVIKNVGNLDGPPVQYRYYASANPLVTTSDVPLPIVSSTGAVLDSGEVELEKGQSDARTELVRIPAGVVPGLWHVGVVVDVGNTAVEHDKGNNAAVAASTVQIVPSTLVITTQQLPDATLGLPFDYRLAVQGAQENLTWTVEGGMPPGMTLRPDGTVTGVATGTGVFTFTAVVSNGKIEAMARLVLRVLSPSSELTVTTASLPPVINSTSVTYRANFAAAGGTRPYTWRVLSGVLPNGLVLSSDGTIEGAVKPGVAIGETPLLAEVTDGLGNRSSRQLRLKVVEAGALVITSLALSETMVDADYLFDVAARNADQSPLARPLTWKIASGRLPEGLSLTVAQDELGLLTGRPVEAGDFVFSLQVTDARGRSDVADFILRVHPARAKISAVNPPGVLRPGDEVSYQFTTGNALSRYRLFSGALPPGLTLDENGQVTGTVQMEDALGIWNFVVEANAPATGSSLGAFALEVQPQPQTVGCSAAGGGAGWLALLAPLAALFGRRRAARVATVLTAAAVAVLPSLAMAQTAPTYVVTGPFAQTYQALTSGSNVAPSLTTSAGVTGVSLPFDFEFYGETRKQVGISLNGYLTFDSRAGHSSNLSIPHNSTAATAPHIFIAPWWDAMNKSTSNPATIVRHGTLGSAPNRTFVVDWQNMCPTSSCSTARVSFQAQLHEGTNKIRFVYGQATGTWAGSASVGIQRALNAGQAGLSCGASCGHLNWPANQAIEASLPPDLLLRSISVDDTGFVGVPFQAAATVGNNGGLRANMVRVRYWLSTDATIDTATDILLGTSSAADVDAGVDTVVLASLTIPTGTEVGQYYLLSRVDPDNNVAETRENNNDGVPLLFRVGAPTPDLTVDAVSATPATVGPGATLNVTRTVRNLGNAASGDFTVTYFVSDNQVVSITDTEIHKEQLTSLGAAPASSQQSVSMALPSNLKAGRYWIGACADWDSAANPPSSVTEISEVNNCATASTSFVLNTGAVTVLTSTLPGGTQNAPYGQQLEATGGNGSYTWKVESGTLPPGMSLAANGLLSGNPSSAGSFSFTVEVSSGGEKATRALSLTVTERNLPLAIADHQLPSAEFGQAYRTQLVAVGGVPPYLWTLKSPSRLPVGLNISPDGFIEGRTTSSSDTAVRFTVEVEDRAGTRAAKDLEILVTRPGSLQIATTRLPTAYLDEGYNASLSAVGGNGTYAWRVLKFQKLTQTPMDVPGPELTGLPDGFGLIIQGPSLGGTPRQAGLYAVTLRVSDMLGAEDITTLPLLVSYKRPLSVTTTALPDAFVGQPYDVKLSHNQDASKVTVTWSETCVQQAASGGSGIAYTCLPADANQRLPEGLVIGAADGSITGVPVAPAVAAAEGSEGPVYSFLVRAVDDKGRTDVRSLSIRVRPARASDSGGCSGTGLGPAALGLLALAGVWRRRRS